MSKIYEAIKQAEQERAGQRDLVNEIVSRFAAEQDALDVALGECRAQLAELRGRLEKFEAENGSANQRIDRTAESFASAIGTLHGRLDDVGHQIEAGAQEAHENVGNLQGLVNTTIEDWNKRLAALADEVRSMLEGNAPAVEELRHGVARLRQLQAQSSDELHALIETVRLRAGDATQRIDALGGRLQTQDELLRSLEKAHVAFEAVLSAFESQVHELAEQSHASTIEQEKLRNGLRDSNEDIAGQLRHVAIDNEHRVQDIRQEIATFRQLVASTTSTLNASLDEHHGHTETVFQQLTTRIASGEQQAAEQLRKTLELAAQLPAWNSAQERASKSAERLRTDLESLRAEAASSTANTVALQREIAEVRAAVAAAQDNAADQLKNALEPLAAQLSTWSSAQERGGESVENLRADLESLRAKAAESSANVGALEQEIADLRAAAAVRQDSVEGRNAIGVDEQSRHDEEITELRRALAALAQQAHETGSAHQRAVEAVSGEVERVSEIANLGAAALANVHQQVDTLVAETTSLRVAMGAQARQVAEAMQLHRTSLTNAVEGQPEPLRSALRETADEGRIETEIIPAASGQSLEPATRLREQGERGALHWAAILKDDRWRRAVRLAALVCCVLFGATVLSRLMSAEKRNPNRADFGGEAKSATLRDPRVAPRFASGLNVLQHGDFASAEKIFREVVAICPKCVEARNNLAVALDEEQKRDAAIEQLREALRIQPDYRRARENLERLQGGIGAPSGDPEGLEGYGDG